VHTTQIKGVRGLLEHQNYVVVMISAGTLGRIVDTNPQKNSPKLPNCGWSPITDCSFLWNICSETKIYRFLYFDNIPCFLSLTPLSIQSGKHTYPAILTGEPVGTANII